MSPNQRIQSARIALHLSEKETALRANLTLYELGDIEACADEFESTIPIQNAFRLCEVLRVSIYEVLVIDTAAFSTPACSGQYVRMIREAAQLTPSELDEKIGYEAGFIERVECGSVDLLDYPVELALDIASHTNSFASQVLNVLEQTFKEI